MRKRNTTIIGLAAGILIAAGFISSRPQAAPPRPAAIPEPEPESKQKPNRDPRVAYRSFRFDGEELQGGRVLTNDGPAGRIRFRIYSEIWQGKEFRIVPPGFESHFYRIEVFDPKDLNLTLPIFVQETPTVSPHDVGQGKGFEDRAPVDFDLGPFPPSTEPYTLRVTLMHGGARGKSIVWNNDPNGRNHHKSRSAQVYVR